MVNHPHPRNEGIGEQGGRMVELEGIGKEEDENELDMVP